ncbi:MAG: sugar nucleotide-binding protein [Planctomycetota bacterium]|jgi:dTDP-4-dehydrorhamnose reductase|nr:sugar nucleotide-binding protein [Planctomycetota bacterium]
MSFAQSVAPTLFSGVSGVFGWGVSQHPIPPNSHYIGRNYLDDFDGQFTKLDLCEVGAAKKLICELRPRLVVHAACISSIAECEENPDLCQRVNVDAVAEIAQACELVGAHLLYISTEQVFSGNSDCYHEHTKPDATTAYGLSKAAAERIVLGHGGCVVRIPLLLGPKLCGAGGGADYGLLSALEAGLPLKLFTDEWRTPISADEIWPVIESIGDCKIGGVFHLAGADLVSRFELATLTCEVANIAPAFSPSSIADFSGPARSPRLDLRCRRARQMFGFNPPSLKQALIRLHTKSNLKQND